MRFAPATKDADLSILGRESGPEGDRVERRRETRQAPALPRTSLRSGDVAARAEGAGPDPEAGMWRTANGGAEKEVTQTEDLSVHLSRSLACSPPPRALAWRNTLSLQCT